ncbi:MAG: PAS domain S-box protein [Campylobacterota bacterium]|nr:PAS domain S-box protein [Campylobacterota bacterium]
MKIKKSNYLLVFILLYFIVGIFITNSYTNKVNDHLDRRTNKYLENYNALYHEYKKVAQILFLTQLNTPKAKNIFANATSTNEKIKNKARDDLYNALKKDYDLLKPFHIKQLHFHLPNNESFLRFHRPKKYGDNLTNFRETVAYVNKNQKAVDGFEEGKIYNGFRFVFPLSKDKKHIGSVEISFSGLSFVSDFVEKYNVASNLHISKNIVNTKVFKSEKSNYISSPFKEFYIEKDIYNKVSKTFNITKKPSIESQQIVTKFINSDKAFSTIDEDRAVLMTFIKIKNPIRKNINAMFSIRSDIQYINSVRGNYYIMMLISFFILVIFVYFIYREFKKKEQLSIALKRVQYSQMYQKAVENASPNIIMSSIGHSIYTGNKAFLDFTEFDTLKDFKKQYNCICDLFLERKGYLQKLKDSEDWFDYMENRPDVQHKAIMLKNNQEHIFLVNANRIYIDNKKRCMATLIDITEIENLKDRYEMAINGTNDGLWDWDLVSGDLYFSPQWKRQLGYKDDELKNELKTWEEHVHPEDKEHAVKGFTANMEGKTKVYENKHRLKHKDGSWVWILDRGKTIFNEDGKAIRMVGFHTDITKEYEANQEIMKLQSAFERSPISIIMTDIDANITYVNPNWCKMTGYSKDEVMGTNPRLLQSGKVNKGGYKAMWGKISSGNAWSGDVQNKAKDRSLYWEESTILPSFDALGEVNGYIGFKLEITQKKKLQLEQREIKKELYEKEEMMIAQSRHAAMGEMISMIAHQWRQPLSVISMGANNIMADVELDMVDNDELKELSQDIIAQTNELSRTIDDFKEFFKPNKVSEVILISSIFDNAFNVVGKSLENNDIDVIKQFNSTKQIDTYSRELMQVFINILKNAKEILVENNIKNRKIIISIEDKKDFVQIEISDNAGGIPQWVIPKIFDPYFSTKSEKTGTGLGLYMSKTIVEKHLHGTLEATNKNDGACFKIELPYILNNKNDPKD